MAGEGFGIATSASPSPLFARARLENIRGAPVVAPRGREAVGGSNISRASGLTRRRVAARRGASSRATEGKAPPKTSRADEENVPGDDISPTTREPVAKGRYSGAEDGVASGADAARALRSLRSIGVSHDDAHFSDKLGIAFRWGLRPDADLDELNALFASVGFPHRDPARLRRALVNSHAIVWATVENKKSKSSSVFVGQCVGFARATSDGVFNATIWDVVVSPEWQGCGIGRGMVERLVDALTREEISNVSLYAEPAVVGLYRRCGFEEDPGGTIGMAFRQVRRPRPGGPLGGLPGPESSS